MSLNFENGVAESDEGWEAAYATEVNSGSPDYGMTGYVARRSIMLKRSRHS